MGLRKGLDEVDKRILNLLQDDARISFAEIAERTGVAESTARYRIKHLFDSKVITRTTALLDPRSIGMNVTAVVLIKTNPTLLDDAVGQLASFEESHHVFQTTGEYDAIAVVHVKDMKHLNELKRRIKMISGVEDATVWAATDLVKIETRFKL
jgi:Lrp/AsnC family transcriptional regulator for asnA, asnC and gidA